MDLHVRNWLRRRLSLLIGLTLACATAGLSQAASTESSWSKPVPLSPAPGPDWYPQLLLNALTGDLFAIWTDEGIAERAEIMGRQWDQTSGTWSGIQNLSLSEWEDGNPRLFFDGSGLGLLIWTRRYAASQGAPADGTDIVWRAWEGTAWSPEQLLLHNDFFLPGTYDLIPVETPDAILLFIVYNNGYRTAEYRDGSWSELDPWQYLVWQSPEVKPILAQILRDDAGVLHAAAYGENSSQGGLDRYYYDAYYLTYDGAEWSTPLNLSFQDGVVDSLGIAFDGQGRLHFLWSDPYPIYSSESTESAIWERILENSGWTPNAQVTSDNDGKYITGLSLTADPDGNLHLAWSEGIIDGVERRDLNIYYQRSDGTTWGSKERVFASTAKSRYPSLVVNDRGPAIAWQEGSAYEQSSAQQVYFSRRVSGPLYWIYLPLISK
jgi:hypothetical protein